MLFFVSMKNSIEEIQILNSKEEASLKKTAQRHHALAQIAAALSRKENQKVTEKSQKR